MYLLLASGLFLVAARLGAASVSSGDGLRVDVDAQGQVIGVAIEARTLPLNGNGGFRVLDVGAASATAETNLVTNGDFSQGTALWNVSAGREIVQGEDALYSKGQSAFVGAPPPNKVSKGMISQVVAVKPNTGYAFAADMKTEKCAGAAAHLWLSLLGQDGKTSTEPMVVVQGAAYDSQGSWFTVKHDLVTGPNTYFIEIRQGIYQGYGKVWLDDVRLVARRNLIAAARPLIGTVSVAENIVRVSATDTEASLQLQAEICGQPDRISVSGTLADTLGQDRCVVLWVLLPLDLGERWSFGYDIDTALPITGGDSVFGNSQTFIAGQGMAQYPWTGVYDQDSGLALSVPMDQPRVCRLEYLPGTGYYAVFELGLSQATAKFPGRASFFCDLYRFAPEWGFRAAAQRYYELSPQFFRRHPAAGDRSWGAYEIVDWSKQARPLDCGDCMASYDFHGNRSVLDDRAAGKATVRYIEPNGYWNWRIGHRAYPDATAKPPDAELLADLRARAEEAKSAATANRILQTAVADADGNLKVDGWVPSYGGAHWSCNPDPDLLDAQGAVANQATDAWQDCIGHCEAYFLDGSYSDAGPFGLHRNFRREHFAFVDHPLTFDPLTRKLCYPMPFHMFEFYQWFTERLHQHGLCLLMHWSSCGYPTFMYGLSLADTIGNEQHGAAMSRNQYLTQRTLAYQKPVQSYTYCEKASKEMGRKYTVADLAYGVFSNNSRDPVVSRLYMGLQRELSAAGWEPVTSARPLAGTVKIERFGRLGLGNLHLTVRNETAQPQQVEIELDADVVANAACTLFCQIVDHLYTALPPAEIRERRFAVQVEPGLTRVVRIGTLDQVAGMLRSEFDRQWVGARNFLALASGQPLPEPVRALLAGRPLALTGVVRKLMGSAVEQAGGGVWQRHAALALAEADFTDTMIRLLQRGAWASFAESWPVEPGYPLVLGPGMSATIPAGVLVNGEARAAKLVSLLPQITVADAITVAADAAEALYPVCVEWDEPGLSGSCRWYFDVQVRKPLEASIAPAKLPAGLASNITVKLANLTIAETRGAVTLVPPDGWQAQPDKADVTIGGGQTAAVTFALTGQSAAKMPKLALKVVFQTPNAKVEQDVTVPLIDTPLVECENVAVPPVLDGKLDEACWQGAPGIGGLRLRVPGAAEPTQKTQVWVCCDAENLYVAVRCDEAKMADIHQEVKDDNGPIWGDDSLEIWLVPQHQTNRAAQLIANLLDKHYSSGILPGWTTATTTQPGGWTMEFKVPFACLNEAAPKPGEIWGFNLGRAEHPHKETTAWSPPGFHDRASDGSIVFK